MLILSPASFAIDKYPVEHFFKDSSSNKSTKMAKSFFKDAFTIFKNKFSGI